MGRIGKVIKSYIDKLSGSGSDAQFSSVEEFAGDQRTVQIFGPCNEDFAPPENCKTVNIPLGRDRGFLVSVAYHNQAIDPVAIHGERRIYSTNRSGTTVMAEVFLQQDGTILIKNGAITITANPSGLLEIETDGNTEITSLKTIINNDVKIDGDLEVTGKIDCPDINATDGGSGGSLTVRGKEMHDHRHSQGNDSDGDSEVNTDGPV